MWDTSAAKKTPLEHAVSDGNLPAVRYLLDHGADLHMEGDENVTALHRAAKKVTPLDAALIAASTPCVKLLIQAGANVNDVNNYLARAATEGLTEAIKCLLEAGANPNRPDEVLRVDPSDHQMLAKRSHCWLRLGDGQKALEDATICKRSWPGSAEARHCRAEALILLKEYEKACEELSSGLELDPENDEMDKLFWEAMELKQKKVMPARVVNIAET